MVCPYSGPHETAELLSFNSLKQSMLNSRWMNKKLATWLQHKKKFLFQNSYLEFCRAKLLERSHRRDLRFRVLRVHHPTHNLNLPPQGARPSRRERSECSCCCARTWCGWGRCLRPLRWSRGATICPPRLWQELERLKTDSTGSHGTFGSKAEIWWSIWW